MNIAAQFKTGVFLLTQMGSISSSPLNTSFLLKKKTVKKSFQKILNTLRCDIIMWHGDVIFYNKMTSQINVRPACGCSVFFYLSHGLAWLVLGRLTGVFLARFDDRYSVVFPMPKSMFFSQFE